MRQSAENKLAGTPKNLRSINRYGGGPVKHRRPFWLPASNYYVLAIAVTIGFFFLFWGILQDGFEETPWIPAGVGASIVLGGAVLLREVILRSARNRFLADQRRLDQSVRGIAVQFAGTQNPDKLTLEKNRAILHEIRQKSDAAKVLGKFSEGHREVFELCSGYLTVNARELPNVGAGSPRIAALRRGAAVVAQYHRFHLLQWAEIEARSLTLEAKSHSKTAEKLDTTLKAVNVVEYALKYYPHERSLLDSHDALQDFVTSIKVSSAIEKAERAFFKGNHKRAISLYQDALFDLDRNESRGEDRQLVADRINDEINKINRMDEKHRHIPL